MTPPMSFFHLRRVSFILFLLTLLAAPTLAQNEGEEEKARQEEVEKVEEMRHTEDISGKAVRVWAEPTKKKGWLFDYGGTFLPAYSNSNNKDRSDTIVDSSDHKWEYEANVYGLLVSVDRMSKFYFRSNAKVTSDRKINNPSPGTFRQRFDGPAFELFYWEKKLENKKAKRTQTFTFGRQFVKVGRGISYGLKADGFIWNIKGKIFEFQCFAQRQNPGDNNLDPSSPSNGATKRRFYAGELKGSYKKQTADVYYLLNRDRNTEKADATGQKYQLNSRYLGLGLEGPIPGVDKLKYWSEFIVERGRTYGKLVGGVSPQIQMNAEALDAGLQYLWGGDIAPTLNYEYAYGSGDADRLNNVKSSKNGSTKGDDSAFRAFGGLSMGNALAPALANIRIQKVGGSVKPFGRSPNTILSDMTTQLAFYNYRTDAQSGATSDAKIVMGPNSKSDKIGQEFDGQVSWKPLTDASIQLKLGQFRPGPAYGSYRTKENYIKLKWTFDL